MAGIANPVFAQDFEFDETELVFEIDEADAFSEINEFDEDLEFDDASFEAETTTSLALTARYHFSRSYTSQTTTDISRFEFDLEDTADWGSLGNIEWKTQLAAQDENGWAESGRAENGQDGPAPMELTERADGGQILPRHQPPHSSASPAQADDKQMSDFAVTFKRWRQQR